MTGHGLGRRVRRAAGTAALYAVAAGIAAVFLYPFLWMAVSSFRTQSAVLSHPLRLLPEGFPTDAYRALARLGGVPFQQYLANSVGITVAATALAVTASALGAYALWRRPDLPLFGALRGGFLLVAMYPAMLLVIPLYVVVFRLGLLGSHLGVVLVLGLVPVAFFMLREFLQALPRELVEAATVDGATEAQTLRHVVLPAARPILGTVAVITFLLTWKQWFPILVISTSPATYTLPVALLALNGEYGVDFAATMALATVTSLPVALLFAATQRRVSQGLMAGAVKG